MKKLYIKNMVCNRCIMVVKQALDKLKLTPVSVTMGEVDLITPASSNQMIQLNEQLRELGFEILDDQKHKQIDKVKNLLIAKVQSGDVENHFSLNDFLSKSMLKEYSSISRLFSEVEGITLEQFFIMQKIEKVKEWLKYGELNLTEISYRLGYSSVAHLSAQFKKITGLTPRDFKNIGGRRSSIDQIH